MSQQNFEKRHKAFWAEFEADLNDLGSSSRGSVLDFPEKYRKICRELAIARHRQYSVHIVEHLNYLVRRGHEQLHKEVRNNIQIVAFFAQTFPRAVRREWRLLALSGVLFYGPFFIIAWIIQYSPDFVYSILSSGQVANFERMYDPSSDYFLRERGGSGDLEMFGHYIRHNIGIGLRVFGSGILFGITPIFVILLNGIYIGAVIGHLIQIGSGEQVLSFVVGHGAFELNAIVLAGVAGLKVGFSLIAPGNQTRLFALRNATLSVMPIVYGFGLMLLIAAFIEAFWSSTHWVSPNVKYLVASVLWTGVFLYFLFAGRGQNAT